MNAQESEISEFMESAKPQERSLDLMMSCEQAQVGSPFPHQIQNRAVQELKAIRRELGIDKYEFAKLMMVSYSTIHAWETKRRSIIAPTLLSLWWGWNITASQIAERIFQKAFEGMFLNEP